MSSLGTVEISIEEYCDLKGRITAFADYVRKSEFSIDRNDCASILGFELEVNNAGADRE